jgi:hypothetical protein
MRTVIAFMLVFCMQFAMAQQHLTGTVTDERGEPLPGASVFIANTQTGTATNSQGVYTLTAIPVGEFKLVVTFIGFDPQVKTLNSAALPAELNFKLQPIHQELDAVTITAKNKNTWAKWGETFTREFIGRSAFAAGCSIANPNLISFTYNDDAKTLGATASAPIIINNEALGYVINVTLVDFKLNINTNEVDYLVYPLFKELTGGPNQQAEWEQNRLKAYSLSFMRFNRSLYAGKLKEDGYEVRLLKAKPNTEKQRVQDIYQKKYAFYTDSLKDNPATLKQLNKVAEKDFIKDSLKYYKKVLAQANKTYELGEPLKADNIIKRKDGATSLLHFDGELQAIYKKIKEPDEYYKYRYEIIGPSDINGSAPVQQQPKEYPLTQLTLEKGIPVEINESGYIKNVDLYIHGFWGWWEKLATKLPYDYQP